MPSTTVAPVDAKALGAMPVKGMKELCTQPLVEYPSHDTKPALVALLAAKLFPPEPEQTDPADAVAINVMPGSVLLQGARRYSDGAQDEGASCVPAVSRGVPDG